MIFQEKKVEEGFEYKVEDVFGVIELKSPEKLEGETLDSIVVILLKGPNAGRVEGEVATPFGPLSYVFTRAPQWEDDDELEQPNETPPCEDTPTSTPEAGSESTATSPETSRTSNWLRRFVEALLAEWRKGRETIRQNRGK